MTPEVFLWPSRACIDLYTQTQKKMKVYPCRKRARVAAAKGDWEKIVGVREAEKLWEGYEKGKGKVGWDKRRAKRKNRQIGFQSSKASPRLVRIAIPGTRPAAVRREVAI